MARRKKQTCLTFNPLPSSSPAAKEYNKQIQDRAAAVAYDSSPTSPVPPKRKKQNQPGGVHASLPTPAGTSDRVGVRGSDDYSDDSEPVQSAQRPPSSSAAPFTSSGIACSSSRPARAKQQVLDFSRVRDPNTFDPPVALLSSPAKPLSSGMFASQGRKRDVVGVSSDEDDTSDVLPAPDEILKSKQAKRDRKAERKKEKSKKKQENREKRQTRSSQTVIADDEDDGEVITVANTRHTPVQIVESSDDDDDMPTTSGTQSRKRRAATMLSSSPPRAVESDDDVTIIEPTRKRRRENSDSEHDENDAPITPGRRKLKRKRQLTQQDEEDLNEDLDFLGPSSDVDSSRQPRDSQSVKKNARQQALERLKRKRSGQEDEPEDAKEDEDEEIYGDGEDDGILGVLDDGDDNEDDTPRITSSRQLFKATQEDEDFIDEDDEEGDLGVPDGMPIEFTRYATMSAKHLFKYAVDWMVQKKINPAFEMSDPLYDLTFKKLNDEVQGLAGSKFRSAAWTPEFTIALQARPEIAFERLDEYSSEHYGHDKCDACNRSGHPATFQLQFSGQPYYAETLEDVANPNDEEDDSSSDSSSDSGDGEESTNCNTDAQGRTVAAASTTYYVGKFCMANASTAHALQHWRYHLYDVVVTWLIRHGYNTPSEIVKRDQWKAKKRRRLANKIVDRMEQDGEIKQLWKGFKDNIDDARNSKQGRWDRFGSP